MRTPVIVDTPYPTLMQTAKLMGVSPARAREIARVVDEIYDRNEKKRKARRAAARKKQLKTA